MPEHRSAIDGARTASKTFRERRRTHGGVSQQTTPTSDTLFDRLERIAERLNKLAAVL